MLAEPAWTILPPHPSLSTVAESLALHPGAAQVLLNRGGPAHADHLSPQLRHLLDPDGLRDMSKAVAVLADALVNKQPICVYGDYDVDGTTSTAIMVETLRAWGGNAGFYLPHRLLQGYGLHREAVEEIAAKGFKLLVTCDLGISNAEEVAYAKSLGLQVIIVDHHQVPAELPAADAVINPHRADCSFPFKGLCAAGVSFHLLIALRRELRGGAFARHGFAELDLRRSLDLVALATVADMVPLVGLNRILVARGLDGLREGRRPGLAALCRVAGVEPAALDAQALGFRLGPRINAAGRMGSAMRCVELFLSDGLQAVDLASRLDHENVHRREVEDRVLKQAVAQAEEQVYRKDATGLVVHGPEWHPGVIGIVASRLVEQFQRPTVVIGQGGKGSARSVRGFDLLGAIRACAEHLVKFGGHHAAAGLTLKSGAGEAFMAAFDAEVVAAKKSGGLTAPTMDIDAELAPERIDFDLIRDLERVGPYGVGHAEPLFVLRDAKITGRRIVGKDHLKLGISGGLSAIGFRLGSHVAASAERLDLAFTPFLSEFGGKKKVELRVKALRRAMEE